jgi:hypothetical protein
VVVRQEEVAAIVLVDQLEILAHGAKVIAEMQRAGRLDAGQYHGNLDQGSLLNEDLSPR